MKRYDILTPLHSNELQEWQAKALNDPEISRFVSSSDFINYDAVGASNWDVTYLMDKRRQGLAYLKPDRGAAHTVAFGIHVLPGPHQKLVSGILLRASYNVAKNVLAGRWLEWSVHETNYTCLRLCSHLVEKHQAVMWGCREAAFWDSGLGQLVKSYHYRMPL